MRVSKLVLWLVLIMASGVLAPACMLRPRAPRLVFQRSRCDYYHDGIRYDGTCATKKDDPSMGYCVENANKKHYQEQEACRLLTGD